jgi:hypothetical protein
MYIKPLKIPAIASIVLALLGGGVMIFPRLGIPMLALGVAMGIWVLIAYVQFKRLGKLMGKRINVQFLKANFDAIGMSSPYVDFYLGVRSYLSSKLFFTGRGRGDLWNPASEAYPSRWSLDTQYQDIIEPDKDVEIRVRWIVPQGHHSPMSEFAFRARDNPPIQCLTFEDMYLEVKAHFLGLEQNVGWLQLPQASVEVTVPDHPTFERVRRVWERDKEA